MTNFPGLFESIGSDDSVQRLANRKALVIARERIDQRLGHFLGLARTPEEFDARLSFVNDEFTGIVRVAASEHGSDADSIQKSLQNYFRERLAEKWIQKVTEKPDFDKGGLHRALGVPEDEKIPESKIEKAEESGSKNLKEKAQFAENVKKKKGKKKAKKDKKKSVPPWLKDKDHDEDDDGDDTLEFAASTADGAVPFVGRQRWSPVRIAADGDSYDTKTEKLPTNKGTGEGNTDLDGPSPKIDKGPARKPGDQGWSLEDIDVPSKRHPTETIDPTVVIPKENVTDSAHDLKGTGEQTRETVDLPSPRDYDSAGFADNNQEMAPHTKTFGDNGTDPVTGDSPLETVSG